MPLQSCSLSLDLFHQTKCPVEWFSKDFFFFCQFHSLCKPDESFKKHFQGGSFILKPHQRTFFPVLRLPKHSLKLFFFFFWEVARIRSHSKWFNLSLLKPYSILESKVCHTEVLKLWCGNIVMLKAEHQQKKNIHLCSCIFSHYEPNASQPCDISMSQLGGKACAPPSGLMGWKRTHVIFTRSSQDNNLRHSLTLSSLQVNSGLALGLMSRLPISV